MMLPLPQQLHRQLNQNNDGLFGDLEPTITTQAEKKRHLPNQIERLALKLERLAPAMKQKESMKTKDETSNITQVIGDM